MNLQDIMPDLARPFPIAEIDFLPKNTFEQDGKTLCLALPFADKRTYEDRLNQVCPGEWSTQTSITVLADRIIAVVTVTICGVAHSDVGEAFLVDKSGTREDNPATEAYAQAFKRACSQATLGRYLYDLAKQYLPWNKAKRRFDLSRNELLATVKEMYRKAGLLSSAPAPTAPAPAPVEKRAEPADDSPATQEQLGQISHLARKLKRRVNRPKTYGAAQALLAELQAS